MALKDKSLFLYGFQVSNTNNYIPFKNAGGGIEIDAIVPSSFYTLGTLATAIALAMNTADPANTYTVTVNRTLSSNLQNRITIATNGAYLSLLFSSSVFASVSISPLINFGASDLTGSTTYTNSVTSGTALQTTWYGKNYQPPSLFLNNIGTVNVAASGIKEGISWSIQQFIMVEFQYEAQANVLANWNPFMTWIIKQRPFEFTPETMTPATTYSVTLETASGGDKGLGFQMKEMVPDFPFVYTTGPLKFRLVFGTY